MNRNGQFIYEGFNSRLPQRFTDMIMSELNTAWPADRCQLVLELRFVVMIPRLWSHSRGEIPKIWNREAKRNLITCQCNQLIRQEFYRRKNTKLKRKTQHRDYREIRRIQKIQRNTKVLKVRYESQMSIRHILGLWSKSYTKHVASTLWRSVTSQMSVRRLFMKSL